MKTDENGKGEGCHENRLFLGIRIPAGELSVDKDMIRQILTTNLKKVCTKMILKSLSEDVLVFNRTTNSNAQTCSVPSRYSPVQLYSFQKT
jgi:hypothetical protein